MTDNTFFRIIGKLSYINVPNIWATALKALVCVSALFGMVLLAGCGGGGGGGGSNTPDALAGKWVEVSGSQDMELLSDGTVIFKTDALSWSGTWNIVDKRLVMTVSVLGTNKSGAADYKISGYELTIVDNDGDTTTYVRKEKLEDYKAKQAKNKNE